MTILKCNNWQDYTLLDSGRGMRLEKFGPYIIAKPDPQAIWQPSLSPSEWNKADVVFKRTFQDKGKWEFRKKLPEKWKMTYKNLSFWARLTPFKHTGIFPEQSLQWDFIGEKIKSRINLPAGKAGNQGSINIEGVARLGNPKVNILNLFGYTGIASLAAASAGAKVTHVDASKPSITWARENQALSQLENQPIRWILDDCVKFVEREIKRGNKYDGVIMDPPVYGHGPTGQIWKFSEDFPRLLENVAKILSPNSLFVIINAYAISASALMLENVMKDYLPKGNLEVGELALEEDSKRLLSTGIFARWNK